ncbi:hypothetical protein [uncultured Deinococcus sp.]|uniref:hypothetical protein n=1 Tax=uncultured Deinococcus sp. TaxID=158789 RepID=UPI0025911257|nr:hypothetical protein [uncultured Deinococcus sp.]
MSSRTNDAWEIDRIRQKYAGQGFTEEELHHCETVLGLQLPTLFRAYLSLGGKTGAGLSRDFLEDWPISGNLLAAFDNTYPKKILGENPNRLHLPDDAFLIAWHEAYSFLFFRLSLGDASPVYQYMEGDEPYWQDFRVFETTLDACMTREASVIWREAKLIAGAMR